MARCATWKSSFCGVRKPFDENCSKSARSRERNPVDVLTKAKSMVELKEKIESIGGFFSVAEASRIHEDVGAIVKKLRWADMSDDD